MQRDTSEGKIDFLSVRFGPMFKRWAEHCTKGRKKYPDPKPGVPNWTLAQGEEELNRFRVSAARHFEQWLAGDRDEDHASAVFFNINGAEYVRERLADSELDASDIVFSPASDIMFSPATAHGVNWRKVVLDAAREWGDIG